MQGYVILMVLAVVAGTLFDLLHDKKLAFFLQERRRTQAAAKQPLGAADKAAIAATTLVKDIATFGEFCNQISHCLMFYGFVSYLVTSVVMGFAYPTEPHPPVVLPLLWNVGALMTLVGGYECRSELQLAISGRNRELELAPTGVRIAASRRYVSDALRYSPGFSARLAGSVKIASSAAACAVRPWAVKYGMRSPTRPRAMLDSFRGSNARPVRFAWPWDLRLLGRGVFDHFMERFPDCVVPDVTLLGRRFLPGCHKA
jgi:hypothetical protein